MKYPISVIFALLFLNSCTQMRITRLEKSKTEVSIVSVQERQIQDEDQLKYIAFHIPGFGTLDNSPEPYAGKGGFSLGYYRNQFFSADVTYLYSLSNQTKSDFQDENLSQSKNLSRHDLQIKSAIPLYTFKNGPKERPVLVGTWSQSNYFMITPIQFQNKLNLHAGLENIYSVHNTQNENLYQALGMQKDIFGPMIAQNSQNIRFGFSFTRRSSYQYRINIEEKLLRGGHFANHEIIAATRVNIGIHSSGLDYTSYLYDFNSSTGYNTILHANPNNYLKYNRIGMDLTYRGQYGHQNSRLLFSFDISAGTHAGYYDTFSNRFYVRIRLAIGISDYKPKPSWMQ